MYRVSVVKFWLSSNSLKYWFEIKVFSVLIIKEFSLLLITGTFLTLIFTALAFNIALSNENKIKQITQSEFIFHLGEKVRENDLLRKSNMLTQTEIFSEFSKGLMNPTYVIENYFETFDTWFNNSL